MLEDFIKTAREKISEIEGVRGLYVLSNDMGEISMVTLLWEEDKPIFYKVYEVETYLITHFPRVAFDNYITKEAEEDFDFSKAKQLI